MVLYFGFIGFMLGIGVLFLLIEKSFDSDNSLLWGAAALSWAGLLMAVEIDLLNGSRSGLF